MLRRSPLRSDAPLRNASLASDDGRSPGTASAGGRSDSREIARLCDAFSPCSRFRVPEAAEMPSPKRSGYNDGQLSFEALWAEPELARDEQVRAHGDPPLADVSARQASRDPGERPDTVLHGAGGAGGVRDRVAADAAGGTGPEGGGVPREGRAAQRGADAGRGEGAARADPASPGGGRGGRLAAAGGPPAVRGSAPDSGR